MATPDPTLLLDARALPRCNSLFFCYSPQQFSYLPIHGLEFFQSIYSLNIFAFSEDLCSILLIVQLYVTL